MYVHVCARGCFCVPRCVGKATSVFSEVFVCVFTALQRFHGIAQSSLEHTCRNIEKPSTAPSPADNPKLLLPKPRGRRPTRDVLGEGLSQPSVAEHREGGDLLHPVIFSVANVSEGHLLLRKAGLLPGIFSPLTRCPYPVRTATLAGKLAHVRVPCTVICTVRAVPLQKGARLRGAGDGKTSPVQGEIPGCSERVLPIFKKVSPGNRRRGRWSPPDWDRASWGAGCSQ